MTGQGADWNRVKRKRKVVEIQYESGRETLRVIKIAGKYMESMGVPVKGGYELYPEEAVYLLEIGSAVISTASGNELSLLEAYSILEVNSVPMYKYEVYKQVKRTGLVVLRPRKSTIDFEKVRQAERRQRDEIERKTFEMVMNQNNVPEERVRSPDSFPCYANDNGRMTVHMKVLHLDRKLVNFLPPEVIQNFPTVKALQSIKPPTSNVQRRQPCRPVYLPLPRTNVYCNWQEFNFQMEKMKQSQILKRFRKLKRPSPEQLRREQTTVEHVDYHVFSPAAFSHRLPAKPLFSLICYHANRPGLSVAELAELRNVVLAVEEAGKVNFVSISGGPIDLNSYLVSP